MRMRIYGFLVNRVPAIRRKYHNMRYLNSSGWGRACAWLSLIFMNIAWLLGKRKFGADPLHPDAGKKLYLAGSESSLSKRESPQEFAARLMNYEVISFDVFDTLVFRPFDSPAGLFYFLGEKLNYPDFARIRGEMEWKTREAAVKQARSAEVTLHDIWATIERECGIDAQTGMELEIGLEKKYCFANPYMTEVFRYLGDGKVKIIAASDMYLSADVVRDIVCGCGFDKIDEYYLSCEFGVGKGDGGLYKLITERVGEGRYVHIGDNMHSDVVIAKKNGWQAMHYPNINTVTSKYRAEDMSVITGLIYRGIINSFIHNGLKSYSREYELGFIYGGLFAVGYCQFIHEYVCNNKIDKILFLARDGDILKQVYDLLYPLEDAHVKSEYVFWSRLAATKMSAKYFKHDYFRRFLYHKVNQEYSLKSIFKTMTIEDMLAGCLDYVNEKSEETILTDKNVDKVKDFLADNWELVLAHYEDDLAAGKAYYHNVLDGCKKVIAVDVGWAGSGAISLDLIVNKFWGLNCEIIGMLAGTNSINNSEPNTSEAQLSGKKLISYLFSQEHNRDLWKKHDAAKGDNLVVEMLLSSPTGGFQGFSPDGPSFKDISEDDKRKALECQQGILDFVKLYLMHGMKDRQISGRDAYAPIALLLSNGEFVRRIGNGEFEKVGVE